MLAGMDEGSNCHHECVPVATAAPNLATLVIPQHLLHRDGISIGVLACLSSHTVRWPESFPV